VGNDHCTFDLQCDMENPGGLVGCTYDSNKNCTGQPDTPMACTDFCEQITPNGCDCFGCCTLTFDDPNNPGSTITDDIYLGGTPIDTNPPIENCTLSTPQFCQTCTKTTACENECGDCEICFGETTPKPPAGGGTCTPTPVCDTIGQTACTMQSDCMTGEFCLTGCCVPLTPQ